MQINNKAASLWQLTFSIIFLSILTACQDPGTIGGDFVEKTNIDIDTVLVANLASVSLDPYLGRLGRSAAGKFEDDLFGSIEATSFFKPSIFRSADTIAFDENTVFSLRLQLLESEEYGDTTSTGTYSIYRVNSLWRGSTFRKSMSININQAELIGSFSDANVDTSGFVDLELSGTWKDDYINYFNIESDSLRDLSYRENDFGLAIVPDMGNTKIVYNNFALSSLRAFNEDTTSHFMLDWGFDFERTGEAIADDRIVLPSTFETVLTLNLESIADQISNVNFARAELVFTEDTLSLQNTLGPNSRRTAGLGLGLTLGPIGDDKAYEIGFGNIDIAATKTGGQFKFNLTNLFNNYIFGESTSIDEAYLYLAANDGNLSFSSIFSPTSDASVSPKIIIYGLGSEN